MSRNNNVAYSGGEKELYKDNALFEETDQLSGI